MVTSVHVTINGFEYNLKGKESEEYLKHVASFVEGKVQEIMSKNKSLTMVGAVTLAAVNIADESFKGNKEYNDILAELEEIERENKKLKEELEEVTEKYNKTNRNSPEYLEEQRKHELMKKELETLK